MRLKRIFSEKPRDPIEFNDEAQGVKSKMLEQNYSE